MITAFVCGDIVQSATENVVAGRSSLMIASAAGVRSDPVARQPIAAREPPVGREAKNCSPGLSRRGDLGNRSGDARSIQTEPI